MFYILSYVIEYYTNRLLTHIHKPLLYETIKHQNATDQVLYLF